ncbi:MAG TPA: WD40 repeat domain-containing protein [Hyphomicrobiaceae bacterium]|nr:WD40 repeat domain-containing protein [Hyphomicrobiaceae bacterium]
MLDGHQARAAVYLNEAYKMGYDTVPLRFMLGQAMRTVDALTEVRVRHGGEHVRRALFSPDGQRFALILETRDGVVAKVFSSTSGKLESTISGVPAYPRVVEFLPSGQALFIGGFGDSSRINHVDTAPESGVWTISGRPILRSAAAPGRSGNPLSPDGRSLVLAGAAKGLEIWNTDAGARIALLDAHRRFTAASYKPDGSLMVSADESGKVDLWSSASHKVIGQLPGFEGQNVVGIQFSPDGARILAYSQFGDIRVWDLASRRLLLSFAGDIGWLSRITFSGNGRRLLTIGSEGYKVWSAARGVLLFSLPFNQLWFADAAISFDGDYLYTADSATSVAEIWSVRGRTKLHSLDLHTGAVTAVAADQQGHRLLVASVDGAAELWSSRINPTVALDTAPDAYTALSFGHSDDTLTLAGGNVTRGRAAFLKAGDGSLIRDLIGHQSYIRDADTSNAKALMVTGSFDGTGLLWDLESGQPIATLDHRPDMVNITRFSPDGQRIVTATYSSHSTEHRAGSLWDGTSGRHIADFEHARPIYSIAYSPDSRSVATASEDGLIKVWSTADGRLNQTLRGHRGPVIALAFNRSGERLASTGQDNSIRLWNPDSGELIDMVEDSSVGWGVSLAWAPNQREIAVGTQNLIWLWDPATDALEAMKGHQSDVLGVRYSASGDLLFSRSLDGTIRAWSPASRLEVTRIGALGGVIQAMDLNADGTRLAASSTNYSAGIWDIKPEQRTALLIESTLLCKTKWQLTNRALTPRTSQASGCAGGLQ